MRLPPLRDDCGLTLLMGLFSTQSPAKFATLLMGSPPLGDDCSADGIVPHSELYQIRRFANDAGP